MSAALPLIGHAAAQERFLAARASGRLHHGWIFQGPSGIGKARFARRFAALMLGAKSVDAAEDDKIMQLVLSEGHPDLKWVKREPGEKGTLKQDISVDQIRELNHFFGLKPALSGWRVGVIDALDEMNVSGMNALLKTLEEPPKNAILFLISHGLQPLLPTIRSRCQVLRLYPLTDDETAMVLGSKGSQAGMEGALARGRPGYGLALSQTGGALAVQAAETLLKTIQRPSPGVAAAALSAAIKDAGSLSAFTDTLLAWTAKRADGSPELGRVWLELHKIRSEAETLNLTPVQAASKLLATLQQGLKGIRA